MVIWDGLVSPLEILDITAGNLENTILFYHVEMQMKKIKNNFSELQFNNGCDNSSVCYAYDMNPFWLLKSVSFLNYRWIKAHRQLSLF